MPTLEQDIATIRSAVYGKDMREAIADGFENTQKTDSEIKTDLADINKKVAENTKAIADGFENTQKTDSEIKTDLADINKKVAENTKAISDISVDIESQAGVNYDETEVGVSDLGRIVNLNCYDKTNSTRFHPVILPNVPLDYTTPTVKEAALSVRDGKITQNTNWLLATASLYIPTVSPGGSTDPSSRKVMFEIHLSKQPVTESIWPIHFSRIPEYWTSHLRVTSINYALYESSNSSFATTINDYYNAAIQCIPEVMIIDSVTYDRIDGSDSIYIPAFVRWPGALTVDSSVADKAATAYTIFYLEYVSHCLPGNATVYKNAPTPPGN